MSRSAVREIQVSGISVQRGEVLVPTQLGDPVHGMLSCHAAPLVAGSLQARGHRVISAELARCDDGESHCDAVLYLATCPQQDGSTAAIAAATAPGDSLSGTLARTVVADWVAACGTRTLLAAAGPWCPGALRTASVARQAAAEYAGTGRTVYLLAPQAIPADAAIELRALGAVLTDSLAAVPAGEVVVVPAQGAAKEWRAEAAERGVILIDATCPIVASAQAAARLAADRGHQLVLIGPDGQAAMPGIASQAAGRLSLAETPGGTAALRITPTRQVSYLVQPGTPVEAAAPVVSALRSRYPAARPVRSDVCYAPSDRAGTIHAVASGSDLVLVLGAAGSADARQVCGQARDSGARTQVISQVADISPGMLANVHTIGLVESTSAPAGLAAQVTTALSGLGRLSVARRQLRTDMARQGSLAEQLSPDAGQHAERLTAAASS